MIESSSIQSPDLHPVEFIENNIIPVTSRLMIEPATESTLTTILLSHLLLFQYPIIISTSHFYNDHNNSLSREESAPF